MSDVNQGKLQPSSTYQKRKNINTSDVPSLRFCPLRRWFLLGRIAVLRTKMRPVVTDRVAWLVCLSDTIVSAAKTAEPIEMPFGSFWTRVGRMKLRRCGLMSNYFDRLLGDCL